MMMLSEMLMMDGYKDRIVLSLHVDVGDFNDRRAYIHRCDNVCNGYKTINERVCYFSTFVILTNLALKAEIDSSDS